MHHGSWILIVGLLVAGSACSHGRAADAGAARPTTSAVWVHVTNHYALDMDVVANASGISYRMGIVAPGMVGHFVLRQTMIASGGRVEFIAQATGGAPRLNSIQPRVFSGQIQLAPGDVVDFEITTGLFDSRATVRP